MKLFSALLLLTYAWVKISAHYTYSQKNAHDQEKWAQTAHVCCCPAIRLYQNPYTKRETCTLCLHQNNQLYLTTDEAVVQFSVQQCDLCRNSLDSVYDPHCRWDVESVCKWNLYRTWIKLGDFNYLSCVCPPVLPLRNRTFSRSFCYPLCRCAPATDDDEPCFLGSTTTTKACETLCLEAAGIRRRLVFWRWLRHNGAQLTLGRHHTGTYSVAVGIPTAVWHLQLCNTFVHCKSSASTHMPPKKAS